MQPFFDGLGSGYKLLQTIEILRWTCGFCSHLVSSERGYKIGSYADGSGPQVGAIYICPSCMGPTFVLNGISIYPAPSLGRVVGHLPKDVESLYEEARRCSGQSCFTACVLLCRKILMNTAVAQGANAGKSFIHYVEYLSDAGFIPPNGKQWVDRIRIKGNEATHEVNTMSDIDARETITFTEMLLKFVYEFPESLSI